MSTPHRAKPHQWAALQEASTVSISSCILELRDRVEALEAATPRQHGKAAAPGDSLVDRVTNAICHGPRAAIREVAAWLRETDSEHQMGGDAAATADLLDQEAAR